MRILAAGHRLRTVGIAFAAAVVCGCVFNPYVTSRQVSGNAAECPGTRSPDMASRRDLDAARRHAECVRQFLQGHVSQNAYLNSVGGLALIGLGSVISYRGMRPDNEVNVSALSVGAAGSYGALKWLYRKPREAIYLSGSGVITCAIGQAGAIYRSPAETAQLTRALDDATAIAGQRAATAAIAESHLSDLRRFMSSCKFRAADSGLEQRLVDASPLVQSRLATLDEPRLRTDRAKAAQLSVANGDIAQQLFDVTDSVQETVNRQLAAQQPDPAELAGLLEGLKLHALVAPQGKVPTPDDNKGNDVPVSARSRTPKKSYCSAPIAQSLLGALETDAGVLRAQQDDFESELLLAEAVLPKALSDDYSMANRCPLARFGAPRPLAIEFPSGGSSVSKGKSLEVTVSGGEPPHSVQLVSERPAEERPTIAVAAGAGDTSRLTLSTSDKTASGRYTLIANDRLGASQTFQVDITD